MLGHRSCLLSPALMSSLLSCSDGETACPRSATYPRTLQRQGQRFGGCWQHVAQAAQCYQEANTLFLYILPFPSSDTGTSVGREAGSAHARHSIPSRSVSLACVRASSPAFLPDLQRLQGWRTEVLSRAEECQVPRYSGISAGLSSALAVSRRQHAEE